MSDRPDATSRNWSQARNDARASDARLGCMAIADISSRADHADDVLESLIEGLEGELSGGEDD